jgi:PadR family transcriptional regulator PadR
MPSTVGSFEMKILLAIISLKEQAYGVAIAEEIEERLGKSVSVGTLYTTLERLEEKGFLATKFGDPTASRGGRAKKYFRLTGKGISALKETLADIKRIQEAWVVS